MHHSKSRTIEHRRQFVQPCVGLGTVEISSKKYGRGHTPCEQVCEFQASDSSGGDNKYRKFDKAILDIKDEYANMLKAKCANKFELTLLERITRFICKLFARKNNLLKMVLFYLRKDDAKSLDRALEYKRKFEKHGLAVQFEYSERNWYHSILQYGPMEVHCFECVGSNPVTDERVRVAVFDFDGSDKIANESRCFCRVSLGFSEGLYATDKSHDYFTRFYDMILSGECVVSSYKRTSALIDFSPAIFEKQGMKFDFKLLPFRKNSEVVK